MVRHILRGARRGGVFVVGVALVAVGVALLILPGPGLLVTAIGLAVLSTEFSWARRAQMAVRQRIRVMAASRRRRSSVQPLFPSEDPTRDRRGGDRPGREDDERESRAG